MSFQVWVMKMDIATLRARMPAGSTEANCMSRMLARIELKFAWLDEPPALIWQARDSKVAKKFLQARDEQVAAGLVPHRVTEHFAGLGSPLRPLMERHAAGQFLPEALDIELAMYELAKVDDTWCEAVHRDVTSLSAKAPSATFPYRAATLRAKQNLKVWRSLSVQERQRFRSVFLKHKAIAQPVGSKAKKLVPPKLRRRLLLQQVYRCGHEATHDWTGQLGRQVGALVNAQQPRRQLSLVQRLQSEYVVNALAEGELTAFAANGDPDLTPGDLHFFQVVAKNISKLKLMQSFRWLAIKEMAAPATVQRWRPVLGQESDAAATTSAIMREGEAEVVDLMSLATWNALRASWRRCRLSAHENPACAEVHLADLVAKTEWDMRSPATPALALLEDLARQGWSVGRFPGPHELGTPRQFFVRDPIAAKAYLRCLCALPDLLARGLQSLPCGQGQKYYAAVLLAKEPSAVPFGKAPALAPPPSVGLPIEDDDFDRPIPWRPALGHRPPPARPFSNPGPKRARVGEGRAWGHLVAIPSGAPANALSDSAQAAAPGPLDSVRPAATCGQPPRERLFLVEGVKLQEETHGVVGTDNYYSRFSAKCPLHLGAKACRKTRCFGVRAAASSGLGDLEPAAFLGVWLAKAGQFSTADEHKAFVPLASEVKAYASRQGWTNT
jgi:hypothetical protein